MIAIFSGFYGIDTKAMAEHRFICNNSMRVYKSQVCNGIIDCRTLDDSDNSDEQNCGNIFIISYNVI